MDVPIDRRRYDPLYGDRPYEELRMPLQAKALVSARRHLFHDHGVPRSALGGGAYAVLDLHFDAHGIPRAAVPKASMPWSIVRAVHRQAARYGRSNE